MNVLTCTLFSLVPFVAVSCGGGDSDNTSSTSTDSSAAQATEPAGDVWLAAVPEGAQDVGAARAGAAEGETLTVRGLIGGSKKPFVEGLAAFQLIDPALSSCDPAEGCRTPWDYCCTALDTITENTVTVEIRDGDTVRTGGLRGTHGLEPLAEVVVQGVAELDAQGNVTIVASGMRLVE